MTGQLETRGGQRMEERALGQVLPPRTARMWIQAVRPFSFTASIVPVLLGTAVAAVAIQGAANLFSDYFDYRGGYDTPESFGGSGVLIRGILLPSEVFLGGLVLLLLSAGIGVFLATTRGSTLLLLGGVGVLGAYFYSGRPVAYKYRALGDPVIFLLFGPLMALGAYFVQARAMGLMPVLYALPVGCLVTAILHVNNMRDIPFDARGGGVTVARLLGLRGSQLVLDGLVLSAYGLVLAGVATGTFVRGTALTLLSAPLAWGLRRRVRGATGPRDLVQVDVATARLHLVFGLLLVVGVLL